MADGRKVPGFRQGNIRSTEALADLPEWETPI